MSRGFFELRTPGGLELQGHRENVNGTLTPEAISWQGRVYLPSAGGAAELSSWFDARLEGQAQLAPYIPGDVSLMTRGVDMGDAELFEVLETFEPHTWRFTQAGKHSKTVTCTGQRPASTPPRSAQP